MDTTLIVLAGSVLLILAITAVIIICGAISGMRSKSKDDAVLANSRDRRRQ